MCVPVAGNNIPALFHVALVHIVVGERGSWRQTGNAMYWHGSCHISLLICNASTYHISEHEVMQISAEDSLKRCYQAPNVCLELCIDM